MTARQALTLITALLVSIGILMVYSASISSSALHREQLYMTRHLTAVVIAAIGCAFASMLPVDYWRRMAWPFLAVTVFLLVAVLIPGVGTEVNGARRWFRLGRVSFQPSELAKLSLVVCLAALLSQRAGRVRSFLGTYVPAMALTGVVCGLIAIEPDFGTAALMGLVAMLMCFVAGVRKRYLSLSLVVAGAVATLLICTFPHMERRLVAHTRVWQDPQGAGYHAVQSLVSIGSGGVWGKGLGRGLQKLSFLPEANTDFVFAVIAEELGLPGTATVLLLFLLFMWACFRVLKHGAHDPLRFLLAFGIAATILIQAGINFAVATVLIPTKGIALPFVSYGGSNLFMNLISVGILLSIAGRDPVPTGELTGAGMPQPV